MSTSKEASRGRLLRREMTKHVVEALDLPAADAPLATPGGQRRLREHLVRHLRGSPIREAVADENRLAAAPACFVERLTLVVSERRSVAEDALPALPSVGPERIGSHLDRRELGAREIDGHDLREPAAEHRQRDRLAGAPAREGGK